MPVRAVLMGFFGMPPTAGDDPAITARFFIDAKEAYWFTKLYINEDVWQLQQIYLRINSSIPIHRNINSPKR